MEKNYDKFLIVKIIISVLLIITGSMSLFWAFEIRTELDNVDADNYDSLESEVQQEIQKKTFRFLIEFIFGVIFVPAGILLLLNIISNLKYRRINVSKERKLAYFHTQFGFGLLVIAILISFSVQSMNDDRQEWMYLWGILSIIGVISLVIYRERKLHEIFDSDHDVIR